MKDKELVKELKVDLTHEEFHFLLVSICDLQMKVVGEPNKILNSKRKKEILSILDGLEMKLVEAFGKIMG